MEEQQQTLDEFHSHSEYLRKLNQQIVQKDNIIKLLQLQIKNIEEQGDRGSSEFSARVEGELKRKDDEIERLRGLLERVERAGDRMRASEDAQLRETASVQSRIDEIESRSEALQAELAQRDDEIIDYIAQIEQLRTEPAPPSRDIIEGLEAELDALRKKRSPRKDPKAAGEIDRLGREKKALTEKVSRLEELLDDAHREVSDPLEESEETEELRADLEGARRTNHGLELRVEALDKKLARARDAAKEHIGADTFALVQESIELAQKLEDMRTALGEDPRIDEHWASLQESLTMVHQGLGIEKIPTVGQAYDGELHQAIQICYSEDYDNDVIVREVSQGYMTAASVIKPADVVVSRNPFYCPSCKKVAVKGSRFCNICGSKVLGSEATGACALDTGQTCASLVEIGWCQEQAEAFEEARASYTKALAIEGRHRRALLGLARVDEAQGAFEDALARYERVLKMPGAPPEAERHRHRLLAKLDILKQLRRIT